MYFNWKIFTFNKRHLPSFLAIIYFLSSVWTTVINAQDMITNDQLCPDPLYTSSREERTMLINQNLRPVSLRVSNLVKKNILFYSPCTFDSTELQTNLNGGEQPLLLSVKGISVSNTQFNFHGSKSCSSFIKFILPQDPVANKTELCRMIINRFDKDSNPKTHHTSLWTLPANQLGFLPPPQEQTNDGEKKPMYLTILYKANFASKKCVFQVQQYAITASSNDCDTAKIKHQMCATYKCTSIDIYGKLGYIPLDVVGTTDDDIGWNVQDNAMINGRGRNAGRNTTNFHAALFSGMTRAISFLFVLSILVSCISYQLKPYLRPSSSFEDELSRDRSHESHRRCYRRPNSQPVLPFSRTSTDDIHMEHSASSTHSSRPHRPRRYFHHTCHRSVGAAPSDLPSYNSQEINSNFCQPPPPYETVQPPSYAETMQRTIPTETPVINATTTDTSTTNNLNK